MKLINFLEFEPLKDIMEKMKIDKDEEIEIEKMIRKQLKKTSDRQKLIAYLARQGFSYDLIKSKLDQFLSLEEEYF